MAPTDPIKRLRQLHAMLGSPGERGNALTMVDAWLRQHGKTWNDLPELLHDETAPLRINLCDMAPRKPQHQKKRQKKRKRSVAEEITETRRAIRRVVRRVGGKEEYYRLVEQTLQQPAQKVGRPAAWRDGRLLLHLEWFYRHRPQGSTKTRYELTREFVKALWDDPAAATGWLKGTAISKQAATARFYRKWNESGYGKLPAEELSDAHVRLVMRRIPFGADPPSLNNYRWIWSPLPPGRTAAILTEPERSFQRKAECQRKAERQRKAGRLPEGEAE